jgi:predicted phosphodiesterase
MRYGVISDVHANLAALDAALATLDRAGVDRVLCLGDLVGYGPLPNECVARVADSDALVVAGNHDLVAAGRLDLHGSPRARATMAWTREALGDDARAFLRGLPTELTVDDHIMVTHASLGDPCRYIWGGRQAAGQLERLAGDAPDARVLLLGHTHEPLAAVPSGRSLLYLRRGTVAVGSHDRVLLNPGSVGDSRLWSAAARMLVLDAERLTAQFVAVRYRDAAVHHRRPPLLHADVPRRMRRRAVDAVAALRRGPGAVDVR